MKMKKTWHIFTLCRSIQKRIREPENEIETAEGRGGGCDLGNIKSKCEEWETFIWIERNFL